MNYPFTDGLRSALAKAREEAQRLGHDYVGTEHLLLGLVGKEDRPVSRGLTTLGTPPAAIREAVAARVKAGTARMTRKDLPYTSRAKKTLELALEEARRLGDGYVGEPHLLLGLIREERGIAAKVLDELGVSYVKAVRRLTEGAPGPTPAGESDGAASPVWFLEVDADADTPIYEQIIAGIEEAVATGRLAAGERLPPVRQLAEELGVAPGTVARAYTALERQGVIETAGSRGTFVSSRPGGSPRGAELEGLLRPVAIAAFHLGASAAQLRAALERAMKGILQAIM